MARIASEAKYIQSIFSRRGQVYRALRKRYPRVMARVERAIEERRCPICGRRFKRLYALRHHLVNGPCSRAFFTLINFLMDRADEEEVLRWLA